MARAVRALLLAALCWPAAARAGQDALLWTALTANGPLGGGVLFTGDAQARIGSGPQDFRQYLVRAGLGARVGKHVTAHAGYAYFRTGRPGRLSNEHRLWQQLGYPIADSPRLHMTGRTRLEQRFLGGADRTSWRIRQQLRAALPLGSPRHPSAVVSGEAFFNLNGRRGAPRAGLDRWRVQAGLTVPIVKGLSFEPAYLHQYIPRRGEDVNEHILVTAIALRW